jgi:Flp pilus assembly protein TadD
MNAPGAFQNQKEWLDMMEQAAPKANNAMAWYHLGVMRYDLGDVDGARKAWETALTCRTSPWPLRNLGRWQIRHGDKEQGLSMLEQAARMLPDQRATAIECGNFLIKEKQYDRWLALLSQLGEGVRADGRLRMLEAQALIESGKLDQGEAILLGGIVVADIREGEVSLSELWYRLQEKKIAAREGIAEDEALRARVIAECPPPAELDFRMVT